MDFGTIRSKLDANLYTEGPSEFLNDVSLTFENCLKYSGFTSEIRLARELLFEGKLANWLPFRLTF